MRLFFVFTLLAALGLTSCGGGSNNDQACDAATEALFEQCVQTSLDDQRIIWNTLQGAGVSVSFDEIATASPSEVTDLCKGLFREGQDMSDEDLTDFEDALAWTTSCQDVADILSDAASG